MSSLLGLGITMIQTVVMVVYVVHVGSGPCSLSLLVWIYWGRGDSASLEWKEMMLVVSLSTMHT